jgi:hypothetical protein
MLSPLRRDAPGGDERLVRDRHALGEKELDRVGVAADLTLRGLGSAQRDEVHESSSVDRPVELGVGAHWHDGAGKLPRNSHLDEPLVGRIGGGINRSQLLARRLRDLVGYRLEGVGAGLADLRTNVLELRNVELVGGLRVPHREFVERADPVPEPLSRDEQRRADVEAKCVVLEGGAVALAQEEADQTGIGVVHLLLAASEADARGIDDRQVARHGVVEPDEAMIENLDRPLGDCLLDRTHVTESIGHPGGDRSLRYARAIGGRRLFSTCLVLLCALVAAEPAAARAKPLPSLTPARSDALSRALAHGRLTEAQYALERAQSLFRLQLIRRQFGDVARPDGHDGTLILRDLALRIRFLSGEDRQTAQAILARPTDSTDPDHHYPGTAIIASACDSTRPLCFHWDENPADADAPPGADSVAATIPADVQATMDTFAGVYDLEVGTYSFQPPKPDNTSTGQSSSPQTDIYLADVGADGVFGYCTTDDPHLISRPKTYPYWDASAYCVVDEDFTNSVFGGIDPGDARDVTAAHEFFHAIQFHYDIAEDRWLMEGTAMFMEGQFRPDVKDRIRYLDDSTMLSPATPVDRGAGGFQYGAWIFWRFLVEDQGELANPLIIREIWERADGSADEDGGGPDIVGPDDYSLQAVRNVLTQRGFVFRDVFGHFAWVNRIPASFYAEGAEYPAARPAAGYVLGPSRRSTSWLSYRINHLAHRYLVLKPSGSAAANMRIRVRVDLPNLSTGSVAKVLVRYVGGAYKLRPIALDSAGNGSVVAQLGRGVVKEADLILTNASARFECWEGTNYSCNGRALDDGRTYAFRVNVL